MKNFRANANEINKTPTAIRYVFIVKMITGAIRVSTSWRTLNEHLGRPMEDIDSIRIVDLFKDQIYTIRKNLKDELLDSWREYYHDYEWDIPYQFTK